jgi:hypothetical protein
MDQCWGQLGDRLASNTGRAARSDWEHHSGPALRVHGTSTGHSTRTGARRDTGTGWGRNSGGAQGHWEKHWAHHWATH